MPTPPRSSDILSGHQEPYTCRGRAGDESMEQVVVVLGEGVGPQHLGLVLGEGVVHQHLDLGVVHGVVRAFKMYTIFIN